MSKPTGDAVAAKAIALQAEGHTYQEMDCQAFVEACVNGSGGSMDYAGSNAMARNVAWMGTLANAKADGKLVPGAGLLIHEDDESGLPARYKGDGLGDFSHVGLYVGEKALQDTDKSGKTRWCNTVHSSASRGRVVGGPLGGGWTHVVWFKEIDYGVEVAAGVTLGAEVAESDTVKDNPEGISDTTDVSQYYTVKRGCRGGAVRRLQTWLNDLNGGEELLKDGDFGPATYAAVVAFQTANGLTADGVVGQKTWAALQAARQAAMGAVENG